MSEQVVGPRLGLVGWLRFCWRQLTSMRTALLLLMLLALAAVPGSLFPQRRVDPTAVEAYLDRHPDSGPWLDRLWAFDVYASPWFAAIYLLLFISLVGCVLPRARRHWAAMRAAPPRTPSRLDRLPASASVTIAAEPATVLDAAERALRGERLGRHRVVRHPDGSVAAERGYLAETGNLVFHLALLGVLVAVAIGSLYGWTGQALVVTGHGFSNTLPMYDSFRPGGRVSASDLPPFSFRLDDLRVRFEEDSAGGQFGAPREFEADVTVRSEPGADPERVTVRVNHPLEVAGVRAFLVGNGYAAEVTVRDAQGEEVFAGPVPFEPQDGDYTSLGVIKVPDAQPRQLGFVAVLLPTAAVGSTGDAVSVFPDARRPRLVVDAYAGDPGEDDLGLDGGAPQSVYRLDTSRLAKLRTERPIVLAPGQSVELPEGAGSLTFDGLRRYAAFDVHHDPSKGWALGFAAAALVGLALSLFVRRRRVWFRAEASAAEPGRTVVTVGALARGADAGLAAELERLLAAVVGYVPAVTAEEPALIGEKE